MPSLDPLVRAKPCTCQGGHYTGRRLTSHQAAASSARPPLSDEIQPLPILHLCCMTAHGSSKECEAVVLSFLSFLSSPVRTETQPHHRPTDDALVRYRRIVFCSSPTETGIRDTRLKRKHGFQNIPRLVSHRLPAATDETASLLNLGIWASVQFSRPLVGFCLDWGFVWTTSNDWDWRLLTEGLLDGFFIILIPFCRYCFRFGERLVGTYRFAIPSRRAFRQDRESWNWLRSCPDDMLTTLFFSSRISVPRDCHYSRSLTKRQHHTVPGDRSGWRPTWTTTTDISAFPTGEEAGSATTWYSTPVSGRKWTRLQPDT